MSSLKSDSDVKVNFFLESCIILLSGVNYYCLVETSGGARFFDSWVPKKIRLETTLPGCCKNLQNCITVVLKETRPSV